MRSVLSSGGSSGTRKESYADAEPPFETESETGFMRETETEAGYLSVDVLFGTKEPVQEANPMELPDYLRICRRAYGSEFTFAWHMEEDPELLWQEKILAQREKSDQIHYRDLLNLYRLEGQRFPRLVRSAPLLQRRLRKMVDSYEGAWSVYTMDLFTEEEVCVNDRPMKSASIMKLFVMAAVYQAIEDGELKKTSDVNALLSSMISVSSNEDANRLLALLGDGDYAVGIGKVNTFLVEHGYSWKSHEFNGFQNESTVLDKKHNNRISARDCARLLYQVYHRQFGSYIVCSEIEKYMLAQQSRSKIPAGIARAADGVLIGNKTGEMDLVENDVAIVYSPKCDYIVCIFSMDWSSKDYAIERIRTLSEEIYRYYNDEKWVKKAWNLPEILIDDSLEPVYETSV